MVDSVDQTNQQPVNVAAMVRDEVFLDRLTGCVVVTDDDLSRGLYALRRHVQATPAGDLVDPEDALAAIRRGRRRAWRLRMLARSGLRGNRPCS